MIAALHNSREYPMLQHKKEVLLTNSQIQERLQAIACDIAKEYQGKNMVLVAILNGAMVVAADLLRFLWQAGLHDIQLETMKASSYGAETQTSGKPQLLKDAQLNLEGRHVLIVEDILDTGLTMDMLLDRLQAHNPASLETFALLVKSEEVRRVQVPIKYVGFEIEDYWVEGYGIDTAEMGRGNPDVLRVIET
jgi:hypoxanthine phosphoribosyltransferase